MCVKWNGQKLATTFNGFDKKSILNHIEVMWHSRTTRFDMKEIKDNWGVGVDDNDRDAIWTGCTKQQN